MNFQAGGKSGRLLKTRKQAVIAIRLLLLAILALTIKCHAFENRFSFQLTVLLGVFVVSNMVFWFLRREKFESRGFYGLILLLDIGFVSIVTTLLGINHPEFFTVFFLTILISALAHRTSVAIAVSLCASILFTVAYSYSDNSEILLSQDFFLCMILLFVTALLVGYIAEAMEIELKIALQSNPTSGLPGYSLIRAELEKRIAAGAPFAVCYIDNDNFKAYNDHYGYARGDSLIKTTAKIIVESVHEIGNRGDFIGHIGGDDFLVITTPEAVNPLANRINQIFGVTVRDYYDTAALEQGFIKSHDRKGVTDLFPVMGLSIAVVSNVHRDIKNPDQIATIAAQLKKKAKSEKSRIYVTGDTTAMRTKFSEE